MKRILFPTEFSPNLLHNYLYALDWAKKYKATLIFMHALGYSEADRSGHKKWEEVGSEFMDRLLQFTEENTPEKYKSVKLKFMVRLGFPAATIEKVVEEEKIDMVVMGMQAHPTPIEAYFSSVALDTINLVDVPVLLIPDTASFKEIKTMVYTFNFEFKELVAIRKLLKLGSITGTDLTCLHILESDEKIELMNQQFETAKTLFMGHEKYKDRIDSQMIVGRFEDMIDQWVRRQEIDLLVMLSHKRNFKTKFLDASTTTKITRKMDIPVMVLKEGFKLKRDFV